MFPLDLSCPYERCLEGVKTRNFSRFCHSGNGTGQEREQIYDYKQQEVS